MDYQKVSQKSAQPVYQAVDRSCTVPVCFLHNTRFHDCSCINSWSSINVGIAGEKDQANVQSWKPHALITEQQLQVASLLRA